MTRSRGEAEAFASESSFIWHQRFQLAPGFHAPGPNDIEGLFAAAGLPADLSGKTVLDIGTANGGACFEAERRGAARVVGVDIYPPDWFGFDSIRAFLDSSAEFIQASIYELPSRLEERFDIVLFWGVLYHLRHPLLALDSVRQLAKELASIETAVADHEVGALASTPLVRYYRADELAGDGSNWFAPTIAALEAWCWSCGLAPEVRRRSPDHAPSRCVVNGKPTSGDPEYLQLSYERPLRCLPT